MLWKNCRVEFCKRWIFGFSTRSYIRNNLWTYWHFYTNKFDWPPGWQVLQLKTLLSWYGLYLIHLRVFSHHFTSTLVSETTFWCMHTASYSYICTHYFLLYCNILSLLDNKASGENHLIKHRPKWSVIPAGMPSQILMRIAATRGDRRNVIFISEKLLI